MTPGVLSALLISLEVALCATAVVLVPGIFLGRLLARRSFFGKSVVETIVSLPLVLPPTAVGYVILRLLSRDGPLGERVLGIDPGILFTWKGASLASAVMALPLVARTSRVAFELVDPRLESLARTLGLSGARTFVHVTLPLARRGLLAAVVMGFSRALGEFGATILVAGNIPGKTQTLPLAIFQSIQTGRDDEANLLLGVTVVLAFVMVWIVEILLRKAPGER